jgi:hypothetical protein
MPDSKKNTDTLTTAENTAVRPEDPKKQRMGIRLAPVENSDQPVLANYTSVNVAPGMVFIDFGFLEPGMLNALPRVAKEGGKLPESLNGKLAVRVAIGFEGVAAMHQQLGQVLKGLSDAQVARAKKEG